MGAATVYKRKKHRVVKRRTDRQELKAENIVLWEKSGRVHIEDVNMIDADRRPNVSFVGCGTGKLNWWRHSQTFTTHTHAHTSDHRK